MSIHFRTPATKEFRRRDSGHLRFFLLFLFLFQTKKFFCSYFVLRSSSRSFVVFSIHWHRLKFSLTCRCIQLYIVLQGITLTLCVHDNVMLECRGRKQDTSCLCLIGTHTCMLDHCSIPVHAHTHLCTCV